MDTPLVYKGGVEFSRNSDFSHKEGGVGSIGEGVVLKKGGGITFFRTNLPFQILYFSACEVCLCVFCVFTPFLSVFFVFYGKNLVLLNIINKYVTSTSE